MLIRDIYACALAQTTPLLSRCAPRDKAMAYFRIECWPLVDLYLDWKVQTLRLSVRGVNLCENHGDRCASDELCHLLKEGDREFRQFTYKACTGSYSYLKVRVVAIKRLI